MYATNTSESVDTEIISNVDLIESVEPAIKTVAEVKNTKSRQVNLATTVTALKSVTKEQLEDTKPVVIRELYEEATRIYDEYMSLFEKK